MARACIWGLEKGCAIALFEMRSFRNQDVEGLQVSHKSYYYGQRGTTGNWHVADNEIPTMRTAVLSEASSS